MFIKHLEEFDNRRFVWVDASDDERRSSVETFENDSTDKLEVKTITNVKEAEKSVSEAGREHLKDLEKMEGSFMKNLAGFKVTSSARIDSAVHKFHEDKAVKALGMTGNSSKEKIKKIVRNGKVAKWRKTPEAAKFANEKYVQLARTRQTLDRYITEKQRLAEKHRETVEAMYSSGQLGTFGMGALRRRSMLKKDPNKFDKAEKVQGAVQSIEDKTKEYTENYDELLSAKYEGYEQFEGAFVSELFMHSCFASKPELQAGIKDIIKEDQRTVKGKTTISTKNNSRLGKLIANAPLTKEEKDSLLEKYTKLIQPKNRKMRKILDAKDSMEEVAEISVDVLKKLKKGQAVNL
ncbi:hypothetical protein KJ764_04960, partial [Patescibacteria group bacterium]|nr:hypothetical protein [Patescibacteria group bacterium]